MANTLDASCRCVVASEARGRVRNASPEQAVNADATRMTCALQVNGSPVEMIQPELMRMKIIEPVLLVSLSSPPPSPVCSAHAPTHHQIQSVGTRKVANSPRVGATVVDANGGEDSCRRQRRGG